MKDEQLRALLQSLNSAVPNDQQREGWFISTCPFAPWRHDSGKDSNPSFGIKNAKGKRHHYHCFSCDSSGDMDDLLLELRMALKKDPRPGYDLLQAQKVMDEEEFIPALDVPDFEDEEEEPPVLYFPEWWLDSFPPAINFTEPMAYLQNRGIPKSVAVALDLRFDTNRQRVCFPIRDFNGYLVGLHGRSILPEPPLKYYAYRYEGHWNRLPWLGESWVDMDEPVVLVESVFDLAKVYRVYRNVLTGLTAGLRVDKIHRVKDIRKAITMYDHGEGGNRARIKLHQYLPDTRMKDYIPTEEEGDPGDMQVERIAEVLESHVTLDPVLY